MKESNTEEKQFSILPIFLVVLIDMIGIGIIIPILGPLFISSNILFSESVSFATRTIILGLLIASFPLAQFFGAPILGALSDKHGRKKNSNYISYRNIYRIYFIWYRNYHA